MTSDATNDRIAEAFAQVPREPFLPIAERQNASDNVPLPIGHGQTNSQPSTCLLYTSDAADERG